MKTRGMGTTPIQFPISNFQFPNSSDSFPVSESKTVRERLRPEPEGVNGSCQTVAAVFRLRLAVPAVSFPCTYR